MSPDTPDPERTADRPGAADHPTAADPLAGHPGAEREPFGAERETPGAEPEPFGAEPETPGAEPETLGAAPATRRGGGRAVATVLGVTALLSALGVPLGLLWVWLAPGTPVRQTPGGAVYAVPQPEQPIAADGWFSLLVLGFGVLAAIALWMLLRWRRGPVILLAVTLGGLGAAVVAWQVGRRIGLATFERLLETAPPGTDFTRPVDLRAGGVDWYGPLPAPHGNLLLAAFGAAVTYTLLAGWSRWPSLRPEPEPGDWPPPPGFSGTWPPPPGFSGTWPPPPGRQGDGPSPPGFHGDGPSAPGSRGDGPSAPGFHGDGPSAPGVSSGPEGPPAR
ncbi:DUF2567 domain-containing protein [Micromonospora sp. WMMD1128]|uniref:DUF2567 domain-containing protein n=1 Tax=Micromonospora sp. WMMD1128 TaxID=3015150 RepID=UPI00248B9A9F|nr:DUF2567 domain-containing protein [Micromonospora sp. WMMD1128]WBB75337.1 DUF2567 domain-containing protein [Micromonospora sp. WMMD1128]